MCIIVKINKAHQHVHHPRCALWSKLRKWRERERKRWEVGGSKGPKCEVGTSRVWEVGGMGEWGPSFSSFCKEVSVLQQDCVYIESYMMAQLYAKLLLKFSFVWEFCCARLLISVYCCFLFDRWSQLSILCVFFVLNFPPIPTPHLLTLRKQMRYV